MIPRVSWKSVLSRLIWCVGFSVGLSACVSAPTPVDLLVENITVYDGLGGGARVRSIAIRDGKFFAIIHPEDANYVATKTIDGSGKYVAPGLWDAHVHSRSSDDGGLDMKEFFPFGVTSVHDVGGYLDRIQKLEMELVSDPKLGPSIYPTYFMLNGDTFAGFQEVVANRADIVSALDRLVAAGAAQVKVHRALAPDLLPIVVEEARLRDLKVTGHIPLGMHPIDACKAGMSSVQHIGSFIEAFVSVADDGNKNTQAGLDYMLSAEADPLFECLVSRGMTVTPTLVIYPAVARSRVKSGELPKAFVDFIAQMKAIAGRLHDEGVVLLAGTDVADFQGPTTLLPGASLHEELLMMEAAGIAPMEIIEVATFNAAQAIGVGAETGSVSIAKDADFLVLTKDPGVTAANFASIEIVFKRGEKVFEKAD